MNGTCTKVSACSCSVGRHGPLAPGFVPTPFSWEQCCGRQEERAREREAALETAEKRTELETLLASNLHRRRDELRQALAAADVGAARWAVSHKLSAQGRHLLFLRQHTKPACAPMGAGHVAWHHCRC